jgi:hypothetical protein
MLGSDYKKKLPEWIPPQNLEERFGGKLPNVTAPFFPPNMSEEGIEMQTR